MTCSNECASARFMVGYGGRSRILCLGLVLLCGRWSLMAPQASILLCQSCPFGTTQVREVAKSWRVLYVCMLTKEIQWWNSFFEGRTTRTRISQVDWDKMIPVLGRPWPWRYVVYGHEERVCHLTWISTSIMSRPGSDPGKQGVIYQATYLFIQHICWGYTLLLVLH